MAINRNEPMSGSAWVEIRRHDGDLEPTVSAVPPEVRGLIAEIARLRAALDAVREARANHPECTFHPAGDIIRCGWKAAVLDIDAALEWGTDTTPTPRLPRP